MCSTDTHWKHPQCHPHCHRHHGTTSHHTTTAHQDQGSEPHSPHQGKHRASATGQVLPGSAAQCPGLSALGCAAHCCSVPWVPTGLQSPGPLSQPVPHGTHQPFPDHHSTSATLNPALVYLAPRGRQNHPGDNLLGERWSHHVRAAPGTPAHSGAHQQQFISSCGRGFSTFPLRRWSWVWAVLDCSGATVAPWHGYQWAALATCTPGHGQAGSSVPGCHPWGSPVPLVTGFHP